MMLYSIYYLFSLRRGICLLTIEFHMARVLFFFLCGGRGVMHTYIYILYIYIYFFLYYGFLLGAQDKAWLETCL